MLNVRIFKNCLKAYVEQGKLALVPKSSHYYRWVGE